MIRYIIEKNIIHEYATGVAVLMDGDNPKTFDSYEEAVCWLVNNDENIRDIPFFKIADYYNIKKCII